MNGMSEATLIKKLAEKNESAFKELVDKYQQLVVNTCYSIVQNRQDAEDVAQEVFIEVFRSVQKFRADSKISTWLYRISVNRSLNFIRDNKKFKWFQSFGDAVQNRLGELNNITSSYIDQPEYAMENTQRTALLHEAISQLPENQKVAFTLSKYEELSYQEIAAVMELSVYSVESLLHRAKKNLQKKLHKCYQKKCI